MNQIDKQPHELDRWEKEGGALPAENASDDAPVRPPEKALLPLAGREVVQTKIGPTRQAAHDRFFANLMKETANVLENLRATSGHGEFAARGDNGPDETALCQSHDPQSRSCYL